MGGREVATAWESIRVAFRIWRSLPEYSVHRHCHLLGGQWLSIAGSSSHSSAISNPFAESITLTNPRRRTFCRLQEVLAIGLLCQANRLRAVHEDQQGFMCCHL